MLSVNPAPIAFSKESKMEFLNVLKFICVGFKLDIMLKIQLDICNEGAVNIFVFFYDNT